jgi:quercetin dioxygenase-like cupin family protein
MSAGVLASALATLAATRALRSAPERQAATARPPARPPGVKHTWLTKSDVTGLPGREANVWIADFDPGYVVARHTHPGDTFIYVQAGALVVEVEGAPPRTVRAGQAVQELAGTRHTARNASATAPARLVLFQVTPKGKAPVVPVP